MDEKNWAETLDLHRAIEEIEGGQNEFTDEEIAVILKWLRRIVKITHKTPVENKMRAVRMVESGETNLSKVARECGMSTGTLRYVLDDHNIEWRSRKINPPKTRHMPDIYTARLEGASGREVAEKYDISVGYAATLYRKQDKRMRRDFVRRRWGREVIEDLSLEGYVDEDFFERFNLHEVLISSIRKMAYDERQAIVQLYGCDGRPPERREDVCRTLGVIDERLGELVASGLEKIRLAWLRGRVEKK